jgi:hypothetical protein
MRLIAFVYLTIALNLILMRYALRASTCFNVNNPVTAKERRTVLIGNLSAASFYFQGIYLLMHCASSLAIEGASIGP